MSNLGPAPNWRHLSDATFRAKLTVLRAAVAQILGNNILPHFTDHSVEHSDSVTKLVDDLLENSAANLTEKELLILYSACYLHDIGMQFEPAGTTDVISSLNLLPPWEQLSTAEKRDLLRDFHNQISAELVRNSVNSASPPIGLQLTDDFGPAYIARLSHAHCIDTNSADYASHIQDEAGIRLTLLSALLRIADILDESRHRAVRERERTLELDLNSQTHWWRHYYTENVTIEPQSRIIKLWFDFPPARKEEYEKIVPLLQIPQIEAELKRHEILLLQNRMGWTLRHESRATPYSAVEEMPEEVLTAMLKQLENRRRAEDEERRLLALTRLQEARPSIERRLKSLEERKPSLEPGAYLLELSNIAFDLFELGGRVSARWALYFRYIEGLQHLSLDNRVRIGMKLLEVLVEDGQVDTMIEVLKRLGPSVQSLPSEDIRRRDYAKLEVKALISACAYPDAKAAIGSALEWASPQEAASFTAELAEIELLQGDFHPD
jgi:hypothetical protein